MSFFRVLTTRVQENKADQSDRTCIEVIDHDFAGMLENSVFSYGIWCVFGCDGQVLYG